MPTESHFFQLIGCQIDYALKRSLPMLDKEDIINRLKEYARKATGKRPPYSDSVGFKGYDIDRFESCLNVVDGVPNIGGLFESFIQALYVSLHGGLTMPKSLRLVEKSVEHAEFAYVLQRMFPDCRFIHIVRNPYATIVSIRKSIQKQRSSFPFMGRVILSLYNSYYYLFKNQIALDNYLVIKYEDLAAHTKNTMENVSSFLGIPFQECLLKPTQLGKPWEGNSTSNKKFESVSAVPLDLWKKSITHYEIHLINTIAEPVIEKYGYNYLTTEKSKYWPVKGESFRTYFRNRSVLVNL